MTSKIEACKTCNGTGIEYDDAGHTCTACNGIAAQAVERQQAPDYFKQACDKFDWTPEEALKFYAEGKHFDTEGGRTRILCTGAIAYYAMKNAGGDYADMKGAPPELAELQATNKRLTVTIQHMVDQTIPLVPDENNPMWDRRITIDELQATIARLTSENEANRNEREIVCANYDALKAENERLKGGQGKPVAHLCESEGAKWVQYGGTIGDPWKPGEVKVTPLYASPPAPVSGVLPARQEVESGEAYLQEDWVSGWNACLDKVKELNQ